MAGVAKGALDHARPNERRTRRRRELFSAACCRLVWPSVAADAACRNAVEAIEAQDRSALSEDEWDDIWDEVNRSARHVSGDTPAGQHLAIELVLDIGDAEMTIARLMAEYDFGDWGPVGVRAARVAGVLRDIVGNPFRPVVADPAWLTPTAVAVAQGILTERAFDRLPVLADVLQEAGCAEDQLLVHCRSPGSHVLGCWALDLVLGFE